MKKNFLTFCTLLLLILLPACSGNDASTTPSSTPTTETQPEESVTISLEEYKSMVSEFNSKIMDESVPLANVGMYEYNYWDTFSGLSAYGDLDYDAMVEHAMEWLSENSESNADSVNAAYDELIATYAAICDANVDGEAPSDVSTLVDAIFGAYHQLFTIVTRPSGEIRDFLVTLHDCSSAVTDFNEELSSLLTN